MKQLIFMCIQWGHFYILKTIAGRYTINLCFRIELEFSVSWWISFSMLTFDWSRNDCKISKETVEIIWEQATFGRILKHFGEWRNVNLIQWSIEKYGNRCFWWIDVLCLKSINLTSLSWTMIARKVPIKLIKLFTVWIVFFPPSE